MARVEYGQPATNTHVHSLIRMRIDKRATRCASAFLRVYGCQRVRLLWLRMALYRLAWGEEGVLSGAKLGGAEGGGSM